ncbi:MAG: response regulator [Gammaproteobacteria bacterium]|nr:response regulator [Gammaproteobacteria bacterium]NVK88512.1 response regulator [Gammaproteobacteria bacterium]
MTQSPFRIIALQNADTDRRLVESIFARAEFDLTAFQSVRDFISYLRIQPPPRCLVMDLELNEQSGLEVIEKVRRNERWSTVPIIVLAPSVDKPKLIELSRLKISGYIVKPFQPQRLFNDVLKAMGLEVVTQKTAVKRVKTKD